MRMAPEAALFSGSTGCPWEDTRGKSKGGRLARCQVWVAHGEETQGRPARCPRRKVAIAGREEGNDAG